MYDFGVLTPCRKYLQHSLLSPITRPHIYSAENYATLSAITGEKKTKKKKKATGGPSHIRLDYPQPHPKPYLSGCDKLRLVQALCGEVVWSSEGDTERECMYILKELRRDDRMHDRVYIKELPACVNFSFQFFVFWKESISYNGVQAYFEIIDRSRFSPSASCAGTGSCYGAVSTSSG